MAEPKSIGSLALEYHGGKFQTGTSTFHIWCVEQGYQFGNLAAKFDSFDTFLCLLASKIGI